jgi:hypothetical protein
MRLRWQIDRRGFEDPRPAHTALDRAQVIVTFDLDRVTETAS